MIKDTAIAAAIMTLASSCSSIKTEHHITLDHKITIDMNLPEINLNLNHTHNYVDNNLTLKQKHKLQQHAEKLAQDTYEKIKN